MALFLGTVFMLSSTGTAHAASYGKPLDSAGDRAVGRELLATGESYESFGEEEAVPVFSAGASAKSYILVEATTGRVLAEKNAEVRMPIASTTKIMTALLALEQPDTESYFTVDPKAILVEGTSMGLRAGDQVNLSCLAYGMLLSSGNDAANTAAVRIAGSVEKFADCMNQKAQELGMVNSHFVTPSGLHDEEHYSTAADMAVLARYALQNPKFAMVCAQSKAKLNFGNPPFGRWLSNHNRLLSEYPGCIGMKTGFTKKAGRCLVSAARRDGVTLVCVTLSDPDDWRDHTALLDYGFSVVKPEVIQPDVSGISLRVVGGVDATVPVKALGVTTGCVTGEQQKELTQEVLLAPFYYAPVRAGDAVGQIVYYYRGCEVARTELVAAAGVDYNETVPKEGFWEKVKDFFREHIRR